MKTTSPTHPWIRPDLQGVEVDLLKERLNNLHSEREALEAAIFHSEHDWASGANDGAYLNITVQKAAALMRSAAHSYNGYSHHRALPKDHEIVQVLDLLSKIDLATAETSTNRVHDPALYKVDEQCFKSPEEVWAPYQGLPGEVA